MAPMLPSCTPFAESGDLTITLVDRHSRLGSRMSIVAGFSANGPVEVIFQLCDGHMSAEGMATLSRLLPRGGSLRRGSKDYSLRCRVGYCEAERNRAGARVFQATAVLGVDEWSRPGICAGFSAEHGSVSIEDKTERHRLFAAWLLDEFGRHICPKIEQPQFVLEIAGGNGALAHALVQNGVSVTVLDPRESEATTFGGADIAPGNCLQFERGSSSDCQNQYEESLDSAKVDVTRQEIEHGGIAKMHADAGAMDEKDAVVCRSNTIDTEGPVFRHIKATFDGIADTALVSRCAAIVGMHPDEATDAIFDAALAAGKPFAVVPCCVFPKRFSQRRLRSGGGVTGYAGFLRYLREKDSRIRAVRLPFAGRNVVLFMTGVDYEQQRSAEPSPFRAPAWFERDGA
eukprot:TRINITY_DN58231_c0_g1_i1.p1 TRINITY_DN58231_c0_g1~~TRINITY_DN58231_c0_g1_i1.p1  ORF type:complete len:401 (-),score=55.35 TRINITY_DN58231_c0_g1_i1:37-1239(-)